MGAEIILVNTRIDGVIAAWLAEHQKNSERTAAAYGDFLAGIKLPRKTSRTIIQEHGAQSFRSFLQTHGLDLDSDVKAVAYSAQAWAVLPNSRTGTAVSASTHNLRLTAVASFYEYAIRHEEHPGPNPIDRVKRMKRELYTGANPLAFLEGELHEQLDRIDTRTPNGMRDKAMIALALYTGRRLSEIANLQCRDIEAFSGVWYIHWRRTKGGKTAKNELRKKDCPAIDYLARWLKHHYSAKWGSEHAEGYVFPSLSRRSYNQRMTAQGIEQRCEKWMDTSKFHRLRHTFSAMYLEAHGTVHELSSLLGHSSVGVTGAYVPKLNEGKNNKMGRMRRIMEGKQTEEE